MRSRNIIFGIFGLVLIAALAVFASEGELTESKTELGPMNKYTFSWETSTNGIVSNKTSSFHVRGEILRTVMTGTSTGATYSLTFKDASGIDVLAGLGDSVSTNAAVNIVPGVEITDGSVTSVVPFAVNDLLRLDVTVAGTNQSGSIILYVR